MVTYDNRSNNNNAGQLEKRLERKFCIEKGWENQGDAS